MKSEMAVVFILLVLVGCQVKLLPSDKTPDSCLSGLSSEITRKQNELLVLNESAKLKVLNEKRVALGVSPLVAESFFQEYDNSFVDPYPSSIATHLSPPSSGLHLVLGKYSVFHGWEGAQTYYETEVGSKKYFILDEILLGTTNQNLHNWHSTVDNGLMRARFKPSITVIEKFNVCGCGPNAVEMDANSTGNVGGAPILAPPPLGFFILPGNKNPFLLGQDFEVIYEEQRIEIKYIPNEGKVCIPVQVAC